MRIFLKKIIWFVALIFVILILSLVYIPDPVSNNNLLGAVVDKHQLLRQAASPKIIFVGGSNVSFGLDSKIISDRFHRPVINTGIHAGLGLQYILNDVKPFIKTGDVVVLMPEYAFFFTDSFYGSIELVSVLFDVYPDGRSYVNTKQWLHLVQYMPTYAAGKIQNITLHRRQPIDSSDVYGRRSFNEFGDAFRHWGLPNQPISGEQANTGSETVNPEVITFLLDFRTFMESKKATLIILPPVYCSSSFQNRHLIIGRIDTELTKNGIPFAARPERYKLENTLFFNSDYHPNKAGVDQRTTRVIEDLTPLLDAYKPDSLNKH